MRTVQERGGKSERFLFEILILWLN